MWEKTNKMLETISMHFKKGSFSNMHVAATNTKEKVLLEFHAVS